MQPFVKDLTYLPQDKLTNKEWLADIGYRLTSSGASAAFWRLASRVRQSIEGSQIWISKEVSDDLQASDIDDPDFASLEWPHDILEVYFEDRAFPTFLLHKSPRNGLAKFYGNLTGLPFEVSPGVYENDTVLYDIYTDTPSGATASVSLSADDMNQFAVGVEVDVEDQKQRSVMDTDLDPQERDEMVRLAMIAFKVLLFASSEGCAPRKTTEQPTKKQGGKAGFKNRPKRPRVIIEYLPRHRKERKDQASEITGKTHEFNGRRGHWRVYKSERYVQMKGKRQFIYPVPDKNGNYPKRKFRVVK